MKIPYVLILVLLSFLFIVGYFGMNSKLMIIGIVSLFLLSFYRASRSIDKNISLIMFLVVFFIFLMGRVVLQLFPWLTDSSDLFFSWMNFSDITYRHIYLSLFLALLGIYLSYFIRTKGRSKLYPKFNPDSIYIIRIRKCALRLTYITSPFAFLIIFDKAWYVIRHGYSSVFMDYHTSLPSIVVLLFALFEYLVFLYLATLPSKKEAKKVLFLYGFIYFINMLGGDRGESMLAILFIVFYLFLRNRLCPGAEPWIGRKGIIILLVSVPVLIVLLFLMAYIRQNTSSGADDLLTILVAFFYQQGVSVNVIGCTFDEINVLPEEKWYSFGAIIDYFRTNYLTRILFGFTPYGVGTIERALNDYSLDAALTYTVNSNTYFSGGGMGSSFVAEAWYDFGYIGIFVYGLLYGYVLSIIPKWCSKNVWIGVIAMVFFKVILYAPRARALGFVAAAFSVSFWPLAFLIYLYVKSFYNKK